MNRQDIEQIIALCCIVSEDEETLSRNTRMTCSCCKSVVGDEFYNLHLFRYVYSFA